MGAPMVTRVKLVLTIFYLQQQTTQTIMKFKIGDKVKILNYYHYVSDGSSSIPRKLMIHGNMVPRINHNATIVDIYEKYYIVNFINEVNEVMQLGYTEDNLELVSDEFVLPERWFIEITDENSDILKQYYNTLPVTNKVHFHGFMSNIDVTLDGTFLDYNPLGNRCIDKKCTKITLDQFKKYVLKDTVETIEKPKFEVGKWYKYNSSYIKFEKLIDNDVFRASDDILQGIYDGKGGNYGRVTGVEHQYILLTDLSEIQQYLPDGHPDKIKPMEKNEFKKGDYIVITECNSGTTNGKLNHCYKLIDNDYRFKKMSRIPLDEPHRKKARYATPEEIAEYDRLGEPYDITTLNVQQIPVDESLVGRYLKALRNNPRGVQVTTGNYVLITERGCVKVENNKSTWACSVIQKGEFELMPEGFVPPTEPKAAELPETVSEKWEPKVGDWVVILPCPSNVNWVLEMNEFVGKCVQLKDKDYYFRIDEDNKRWSWEYTERVKHFRKAEPHEIPKTKPMNEYTAEEALAELKRRGFKKGVKYTRMCSDGTYCEGDELIAKKDPENREHYIDCGGGFLWSKDNPSHLHRGPISEPITNPCAEIVIPKLEEGISRYDWFAPPTFQAGTSYQAIHNGTPNYLDPASLLPKTKLPI